MPFSWGANFRRGDSAALAALCEAECFCGGWQPRGHTETQSGAQMRQMAGMKKPARGGRVFPDTGFFVCSIFTLIRVQLIIGCVDQLYVIDRG